VSRASFVKTDVQREGEIDSNVAEVTHFAHAHLNSPVELNSRYVN